MLLLLNRCGVTLEKVMKMLEFSKIGYIWYICQPSWIVAMKMKERGGP